MTFEDLVKNDPPKSLPNDGTVHPLTSKVINYLGTFVLFRASHNLKSHFISTKHSWCSFCLVWLSRSDSLSIFFNFVSTYLNLSFVINVLEKLYDKIFQKAKKVIILSLRILSSRGANLLGIFSGWIIYTLCGKCSKPPVPCLRCRFLAHCKSSRSSLVKMRW